MFRRLNFLIPNAKLAQEVVNELTGLGVNDKNIHTYAEHNLPTDSLLPATKNQAEDRSQYLEDIFWKGNLSFFFILLCLLIITLLTSHYLLSLACLGIMLVSFSIGNIFATYIPHVHLSEFKNALSHNELLMMVDVPYEKMHDIETQIHRHHPAVVEGGSSWALKGVDI